jgi:RNA polymerase sigma-70 factor (ECF subfamily)
MSHVIAGEIDKMGILYERYKRPLYAYFYKLTRGDIQASEDLVQTVFYRVIRYKTGFTGQGSFKNWLFRIAHNTGIDHNRRNKHISRYINEVHTTQTGEYENNDLEKNEQHATLEKAIGKLKPDERELIILGKIDCLRYKEIAVILNTSESNVKIRIYRALKKLRDIYVKLDSTRYEKARSEGKVF